MGKVSEQSLFSLSAPCIRRIMVYSWGMRPIERIRVWSGWAMQAILYTVFALFLIEGLFGMLSAFANPHQ